MIEEYLLNYGVLGLWTVSLIFERYKFQREMKELILNNTSVLNKVLEVMRTWTKQKPRKRNS